MCLERRLAPKSTDVCRAAICKREQGVWRGLAVLSLSLSPSVLLVLCDAKVLALYNFQNLLPLHRVDPRHQ